MRIRDARKTNADLCLAGIERDELVAPCRRGNVQRRQGLRGPVTKAVRDGVAQPRPVDLASDAQDGPRRLVGRRYVLLNVR